MKRENILMKHLYAFCRLNTFTLIFTFQTSFMVEQCLSVCYTKIHGQNISGPHSSKYLIPLHFAISETFLS